MRRWGRGSFAPFDFTPFPQQIYLASLLSALLAKHFQHVTCDTCCLLFTTLCSRAILMTPSEPLRSTHCSLLSTYDPLLASHSLLLTTHHLPLPQPFGVSGRSDVFVIRTGDAEEAEERNIFLLQLSLVERDEPPELDVTTTAGTRTEHEMTESIASPPAASQPQMLQRTPLPTGATLVQLCVHGLDKPTGEVTLRLVGYLRDKLEELTLAKFSLFLPQNPNTKLSQDTPN